MRVFVCMVGGDGVGRTGVRDVQSRQVSRLTKTILITVIVRIQSNLDTSNQQ